MELEARLLKLKASIQGEIAKGTYQLMDAELGKLVVIDMIGGELGAAWSGSQFLHTGKGVLAAAYTEQGNSAHIHEEQTDENGYHLTFGVRGSSKGAGAYAAAQEYGAVISSNPQGRAKFFAARFLDTAGLAKKGGTRKGGGSLRGLIIGLLKAGKGVPFWGIMALSIMKTGRTQIPARMHLKMALKEFESNGESKQAVADFWREQVAEAWRTIEST